MSYKLSVAAEINGLGEQSLCEETVLDYTYISEDNFLLIILLTSKANLLTYYKTGNNSRSGITLLAEIFAEWIEPVVIALTKDASVVVLILSNGEILLLPIHCLIDVTWGKSNPLVKMPFKFSIENVIGREDKMCFRLPTSGFCFTSASTSRSYLVFSNKAGVIFIVDLHIRRLTTQLATNESIHKVELYEEDGSKYILVTLYTGCQVLIPLETLDLSVRETLAHVIPSQIFSHYQLHSGLKFFNHNSGLVCAINQKTSNVEIYGSIAQLKLPQRLYKVPYNAWLVYYSPKLLVAIAESNRIFVNLHFLMSDPDQTKFSRVESGALDSLSIIGIVPVVDASEDLEECLLVSLKGLVWLRPQRNIESLVAEFLGGHYFAVNIFNDISRNLRLEPENFCQTILRSVLKSENQTTYDLDGLISLAFELNVDISKLMEILNEYHQADLLLPFLSLKCEKEPANITLRQFLFNAYMTKLWRINQQDDKYKEKEALEYEIKHFLIKFESTPDVLAVLLKQSLWSCVSVLLCQDPIRHSIFVARYLLELPSWKTTNNLEGLVKCLSFIHWPSLDASLGQTLVNKTINILPNISSVAQLHMIMDMAESLVKKSFDFALALYIIVSIRMINLNDAEDSQGLEFQPKLSSASNCSAAIVAEGQVLFWGDFSAGNLRLKNEETRKRKKSSVSLPHQNSSPVKVQQQKRSQLNRSSSSNCVLIPKAVVLPRPAGNAREYEAKSVQCGTEHTLLLTTNGMLFSWGMNRFGQCGLGKNTEVDKPALLQGDWGKIKAIYTGHYHSALLTEQGEVWMFGWGMYGQLAVGNHKDVWLPVKIPSLSNITHITLGYAHSLFQRADGSVAGCGAICNGQLGIDPLSNGWSDTLKATSLYELPLITPIRLLASGYFHGVAVSVKGDCLYEWGECPQSLKMRTFLMKRLRSNALKEKKENNEKGESISDLVNKHLEPLPSQMPRDYFEVRRFYEWTGPPIETISAGFNHSALITNTGEMYTWGKNLEMQLGHGNKKDKSEPSLVVEPRGVRWVHVQCARNSTTAVAADGRVYVWGRNDKNQLGLGILKKPNSAVRRIVFKATKGPKSVDLPDDNHVDAPTVIPGLHVLTHKAITKVDLETQIMNQVVVADQLTISSVSRFLVKNPTEVFLAAEMHLLAGDLLHALDVLIGISERTGLLLKTQGKSSSFSSSMSWANSPSPKPSNHGEPSRSGITTPNLEEDRNGNSPIQPNHHSTTPPTPSSTFDILLDKAWNLVRLHPIRELQTMALLLMIHAKLPIYNRLAADPRLCRLIDPYVELGPVEQPSTASSSITAPAKKLVDLNTRERYTRLKKCTVLQKSMALRQRCDQLLANDQLRFFSDCCHYEKCVVESGPAKLEFAAIRNRLRKCTKCVVKNKLAPDRSSV